MKAKYLFYSLTFSLFFISCARPVFKERWLKEEAPGTFVTRFETTKGVFEVEVYRDWSPLAVDRFYQTVKHGFYNGTLFYRVVPNFVAQWGNTDTSVFKKWAAYKLPDEPVKQSNVKGHMSYARSGKETRGSTLFINLVDNKRLDTLVAGGVKGYPPIGKVILGMQVVDSLYSGYGGSTMAKYDSLQKYPEQFLKQFPKLDRIQKAFIRK